MHLHYVFLKVHVIVDFIIEANYFLILNISKVSKLKKQVHYLANFYFLKLTIISAYCKCYQTFISLSSLLPTPPPQDRIALFKLDLDLLESKASLRFMVFLPQLPECRDYKCSSQLPSTLYEFLNI